MENKEKKITVRQLIIVFIMAIAPNIIRLVPSTVSEIAKQASLFTVFATLIFFIPLLFILNKLINIDENSSLEDAYIKILGSKIAKVILFGYMMWSFLIISVNFRYFAERFASSILSETPITFFLITLVIVIYIVSRKNIEYFARFNEIFIIFFAMFIVGLLIFPLSEIKISNLYPVTTMDIVPIFKSVYSELGIISWITFFLFLSHSLSNKKDFKKSIIPLSICIILINFALVLPTVGIFGSKVTTALSMPFFTFLKSIDIFSPVIERFESIFISLWIATDFTLCVSFVYIVIKLNKKIFSLSTDKEYVTPFIFFIFILANYFANNSLEEREFSSSLGQFGNVIFGFIIPILIYIIGKIRKKI